MSSQASRKRTDAATTIVEPIGAREFHRSVYVERRRSLPLTVFDAFDAPVMSPNCENRPQTTAATQSLMMLNDTFVVAQAQQFAERLGREAPGDLRAQIRRAWRLVFLCDPTETGLRDSLVYLAEQGESIRARKVALAETKKSEKPAQPTDTQTLALASLCQALLCQNRFLYVD